MNMIAVLIALLGTLVIPNVVAQETSNGRYSIYMNNSVTCIHTLLAPNNRIICMERPHVAPYTVNPYTNGEVVTETNIQSKQLVITRALRNPFCAGHAQKPDGNILVIGGDFPEGINNQGTVILTSGIQARRTYTVCPNGDSSCPHGNWTYDSTDMTTARWYPTVTTLYTGDIIIVSGSLKNLDFNDLSNTNNPTYEYYPSKPGNWPVRIDALDWAFPFNLYPAVYQLHNKQVMLFVANRTVLIDPVTDAMDTTSVLDANIPDKLPWIYPYTPTFTMLPLTKANGYTSEIMVCGGSRQSLNADERCISINFGESNPQWKLKTSMPVGRLMPDSVLLPDGTIFFSNGAGWGMAGGDAGAANNAFSPVFDNHIYDPVKNEWFFAGTMSVARLYHSGAILLEDGSVLITGSEEQNYVDVAANRTDCFPFQNVSCTEPFEYRMERYEPPYLLKSTERPVIASAPMTATYGSTIGITVSTDGGAINKASFIRYSTTTHSTNTDQRFVEAEIIARNSSYVLLQVPTNSSIAPPGNYHIFVLNNGVPSVSKTVLLGNGQVTNADMPLNPIANANAAQTMAQSNFYVFMAIFLVTVYLF